MNTGFFSQLHFQRRPKSRNDPPTQYAYRYIARKLSWSAPPAAFPAGNTADYGRASRCNSTSILHIGTLIVPHMLVSFDNSSCRGPFVHWDTFKRSRQFPGFSRKPANHPIGSHLTHFGAHFSPAILIQTLMGLELAPRANVQHNRENERLIGVRDPRPPDA